MILFGQAAPTKPTIPDEATRLLRVNTLAEEVGELAQASGVILELTAHPQYPKPKVSVMIDHDATPILDQVADALADCQYFVDGTATAYGLDLQPFFDEVHRSNMDKLWAVTDLLHMEPGWTATHVTPSGQGTVIVIPQTKQFVVKRQDGKVMKPPGFEPPNLKKVLESQKCLHAGIETLEDSPAKVGGGLL